MTLTIKDTIIKGIRQVFYNRKFVVLLWGFNAVTAIVVSIPIYYMLQDNLGRSLISDKLALGFDYQWYLQFRHLYESNIGEIPLLIYGLVGIYALVRTFFLGGLISVFNSPKKNHFVDFFYGGVKYWYRFTKVLIISLFFFAAAFKINDYLGQLISWGYSNSENAMNEFIFSSLRYIILIFLIGIVTIVSDYSKVYLAVNDKRKLFKSISSAIMFIKGNFTKVFIVFLLVAVIGAGGVVIYNLLGMAIPRTPYYFLALSFILQQMLIIFRLLIRMLFVSTEVILFKDLSAEIVHAEVQ